MRALAVALALALPGCGDGDGAIPRGLVFSHSVEVPAGFYVHSLDPERVRFLCNPGAQAFTAACACAGTDAEADVYAVAGAGDGQPFGVASFVALEACQ